MKKWGNAENAARDSTGELNSPGFSIFAVRFRISFSAFPHFFFDAFTGSRNNTGLLVAAPSLMKTTLEIEVKLTGSNLERLQGAGFELKEVRPRHFEDNWLLDSPDRRLLGEGAALRVRATDHGGLVTYKGVVHENTGSMLKIREEIESEVDEPERLVELFERLGFHRTFRYQKFRTVFSLVMEGNELEIAFDETPIGKFLEIEGGGQTVLQVLAAAGLSEADIIRESYPELQAKRCKQRGVPLEDLVFED